MIVNEKAEVTVTKNSKQWYIDNNFIINHKTIVSSLDLYSGSTVKVKRIFRKI